MTAQLIDGTATSNFFQIACQCIFNVFWQFTLVRTRVKNTNLKFTFIYFVVFSPKVHFFQ